MPGTAAIASALSIACGVSSMTMTSVAALTARAISPRGCEAKPTCGSAPVMERFPSGGNRQ